MSGRVMSEKLNQQSPAAISSSSYINMAIALPVPPPPPVALPSPLSSGALFGTFRKVSSKVAPLVVLGGLVVAVQKKMLGLSKDMEGI